MENQLLLYINIGGNETIVKTRPVVIVTLIPKSHKYSGGGGGYLVTLLFKLASVYYFHCVRLFANAVYELLCPRMCCMLFPPSATGTKRAVNLRLTAKIEKLGPLVKLASIYKYKKKNITIWRTSFKKSKDIK